MKSILILASMLLALANPCAAATDGEAAVPVRHEISGAVYQYTVQAEDSSESIAARFGEPASTVFIGAEEPEPGSTITVDNRHVVAAATDDGVVINLPQRMLFLIRDGKLAGAFPATVGRPDWPTPTGSYEIASLTLNPTWHVPPAIRAEMEDEGIPVGAEVAPGPKNPLGKRWIGLDHDGIGIHGTNHPLSIFHFGSHGCIRLTPESATALWTMVSRSDPVEIVYQPVAMAVLDNGQIFLESDTDAYERGRPDLDAVRAAARMNGIERSVDWAAASRVLVMVEGVARRIDLGRQTTTSDGDAREQR